MLLGFKNLVASKYITKCQNITGSSKYRTPHLGNLIASLSGHRNV
jgi:hypothetical protein